MIRVGIDTQAACGTRSGLGTYVARLGEALSQRSSTEFEIRNYQISGFEASTPKRLIWENVFLPAAAVKDRIQLLHTPAFSPPFYRCAKRHVMTVHDIIGLVCPEQSETLGAASRFYWLRWFPDRIRKTDYIIADSEHTKSDLIRHMAVPDSKIKVVYPSGHEGFHPVAGDPEFASLRRQYGLNGRYFLFVGDIQPRKNLIRVIESFMRFRSAQKSPRDWQLAVVGSKQFGHGKAFSDILRRLETAAADVVFTGYIPDRNLNLLYSHAEALVFPSLYEGFGIPVLEAMASGTPVITSQTTSLPEVGGSAVLYVDPLEIRSITDAMIAISSDAGLRTQFILKGYEQIKKFSWTKTASEIVSIYRELLN